MNLFYSKDGITVATFQYHYHPKADGTCPIQIRVTYQGERKYYSTGKDLTVEDWERIETAKSAAMREVRESIENSFSLVKKNVKALAERGEFSFDALNVRLGKATGDTVNNAFKAKIASLTQEERIGTRDFYVNTLQWVENFGGPRIAFNMITVDWLKRFEKHMLKEGKSITTVGMHMRNLRHIITEGKKAGIVKEAQYPFGKDRYDIKTGEGRKKALTPGQIKQIINYTDGTRTTEYYRDIWFFIYLANGINVADLVRLKYRDVKDGEIRFVRQKTERTSSKVKDIYVAVTPEIERIIERWGNPVSPNNYIFNCITDQMDAEQVKKKTKDFTKRINKRMKLIGTALGIDGISTYTARHSFATILKNKGIPVAYISESLGHNDLKTTENYLASFQQGQRLKNAALLTQFDDPNE